MGKKKGAAVESPQRSRGKGWSSCADFGSLQNDSDDAASSSTGFCSLPGNSRDGLDETDSAADAFQQLVDDLFEARGATRERAFAGLITAMREDVKVEECSKNASTITSRCAMSLRKGGTAECTYAATVLGLHTLTLGEASESMFREVEPELWKVVNGGRSSEARAAAADALAMCCFVTAEGDELTTQVMAKLAAFWRKGVDAKLAAASLRGWALLYNTLSRTPWAGSLDNALTGISILLQDSSLEVRSAAGEAAALVYTTTGAAAEEPSSSDDSGGEDSHGSGAVDDLAEQLAEMGTNRAAVGTGSGGGGAATGGSGRRSRRERAAQRGKFRDLAAAMESGGYAHAKVKLPHGPPLVVETLGGVLTLNWLKRFLASGFQTHLIRNPLLHAVFDFTPATERAERMSALDKRSMRSPSSYASKGRTANRKGDRAHKAAAHMVSNGYDD